MIIVITGPTGVGKTRLSIALAKQLNAEIINCDAIQIYKHLNIGSAKIKEEEKEGIVHHLLDIKELDEEYTAYNYQKDARKIIDKLIDKNKNIILVGGTGLYIKACLYDYNFKEDSSLKNKLLYDAIFIGLTTNRDKLYDIINSRVDKMIEEGLIDEVRSLYKFKDTKPLKNGIGYKQMIDYLDGKMSLNDAIDLIKQKSRKYAKRQYTWFNNQMNIKYFDVNFDDFDETINMICDYIKKYEKGNM